MCIWVYNKHAMHNSSLARVVGSQKYTQILIKVLKIRSMCVVRRKDKAESTLFTEPNNF